MLSAFIKALSLVKERAFWGVIWHGVLLTTIAFIGLYALVWGALAHVSIVDIWWIDTLIPPHTPSMAPDGPAASCPR